MCVCVYCVGIFLSFVKIYEMSQRAKLEKNQVISQCDATQMAQCFMKVFVLHVILF